MGYTRYWTTKENENGFDKSFVEKVNKIINETENKLGIKICNGLGVGKPVVTSEVIFFNGNSECDEDYETFGLRLNGEWDFCKTARKPYDIAVNAILKLANEYGYLQKFSSDGDNEEDLVNEILEKVKEKHTFIVGNDRLEKLLKDAMEKIMNDSICDFEHWYRDDFETDCCPEVISIENNTWKNDGYSDEDIECAKMDWIAFVINGFVSELCDLLGINTVPDNKYQEILLEDLYDFVKDSLYEKIKDVVR